MKLGRDYSLPFAEWAEKAGLVLGDSNGKTLKIRDQGIKARFEGLRRGEDVFNGNLEFQLAFSRWMDLDERRLIYRIQEEQKKMENESIVGEHRQYQEDLVAVLGQSLSDPELIMARRRQQLIQLFAIEPSDSVAMMIIDAKFPDPNST